MESWHSTIRHALWAAVVVTCVTLFVFHPQRDPAQTAVQAEVQTLAKTAQGIVEAERIAQSVRNGRAAFSPNIPAALWSGIAAAGRTPTVTVYSAQYKPPSPAPVATLVPGSNLPANFEAWHHADTVAATEEALAKTPVVLNISQQEVAPNKAGALYLADGSVGASFAIARRKQLDLDLGITSGQHGLEFIGGYGFNFRHTDAGVFLGAVIRRGAPGSVRPDVGLQGGIVVHP